MKISEQNRKYNELFNRFSGLYHSAAVKFGLFVKKLLTATAMLW